MKVIVRPTTGPEDWKQFLAEPDKQWKPGYSAYSLAHCWERADGLPENVRTVFETCPRYRDFEPLLGIPELKVDLPGGSQPSQTDLWLLGRVRDGLVSVAVEGKAAEPFGPTVDEWRREASVGKEKRLKFLLGVLRLAPPLPSGLRYQLLHRTVSAILMASRFHARHAAMIVHSFSTDQRWFEDFLEFLNMFGLSGEAGRIIEVPGHEDPSLSLAWVTDRVISQ